MLLFLVLFCAYAHVHGFSSRVGALVFQPQHVTTQQLQPLLGTLDAVAGHVALCQFVYNEETAQYLNKWAKQSGVAATVYEGHRNACLKSYRASGLATGDRFMLLEWNMRLEIPGVASRVWSQLPATAGHVGIGYAMDMNGAVLDWTPLLVRTDALCGYLGRLLCVDNSGAMAQLLRVQFELDVDADTREGIEDSMIAWTTAETTPVVLKNITIRRIPAQAPGDGIPQSAWLPPADPKFGHAWHWLARVLDNAPCAECPKMAMDAYTRRFELEEQGGEKWYAAYRLGALAPELTDATNWLLDAYQREPRRREPLAALARRYRQDAKPLLCVLFGMAALAIPFPGNHWPAAGPHLEMHLYEWSLADDVSLCMDALGQHARAASLLGQVLSHPEFLTLPPTERTRLEANLNSMQEKQKPK